MHSSSTLRKIMMAALFLFVFSVSLPAEQDNQNSIYKESYLEPDGFIQDVLARDRHYDTLDNLSPDGTHFLIPIDGYFSNLGLMSQKTYRLGMLELCPQVNREWNLSTHGIKGLKIYSLEKKKSWMISIPDKIFISDMTWSPDGKKIAFLAHLDDGTEVWTADVETGESRSLSRAHVMATLSGVSSYSRRGRNASNMLQWTQDGSVVTLLVPPGRGPEPVKAGIPDTPIIRHTREKASQTPTYPFLLRTPYEKDLFEYHTISQLGVLAPGREIKMIGEPAMYENISISPDGLYILAERVTRPFSYIVSYRSFPRELVVMDMDGDILSTIRKIPLQEGMSRNGGPEQDLPRDVSWRPDGKGLYFLWREKKENKEDESEEEEDGEENKRKDRLMTLTAPFDLENAEVLVESEEALSDVSFSADGHYAFAGRSKEGKQEILAFDLSGEKVKTHVLMKDIDPEKPLELPGDIITQYTGNGIRFTLLSSSGESIYFQGSGYNKEFKPHPFIDRMVIETGRKERIFESSGNLYEQPLVFLDNDLNRMVVSRESLSVFPNSFLRTSDGTFSQLTENSNPFPEFAEAERIFFEFKRRDGLTAYGRLILPAGTEPDAELPAVFWTYPREYQSFKDYEKSAWRSTNKNSFPHLNYRNASEIWLSQGYAVVEPDIPIIGKENAYNNHYIAHLVDSMYAAIRKIDKMGYIDVDRLGHGGHSYGAFATANILAHSPFFKAGIAGDGAYNRTLTPQTFQRERRLLWDAQDIYIEMSPFFEADHLETPLLMYHGAQDDNTGTFLIQSERMMHALTGLGKEAVLYIYPFESHGPRCIETYMDLWKRWTDWFAKYVKNPEKNKAKE
jgi:WD40 repeat protein/dienelactone hydrolase